MTRWLNIIDTRYISEGGTNSCTVLTLLYLRPVKKQHKRFYAMVYSTHKMCKEKPKDRGLVLIGVLAGGENRGRGVYEPLSCTVLEAATGMLY
jgi:hypothetical protein